MRKNIFLLMLAIILVIAAFAGCGNTNTQNPGDNVGNQDGGGTDGGTDAVTSASRASSEAEFIKGVSDEGNYIIITDRDLTFDKDVTVSGRFTREGLSNEGDATRALAFAEQADDGTIAERFTVTVPNLIINSENTLLEYGIVKGNVIVNAPGFKTKEAKIDGNLYFASKELLDAFAKDEETTITGTVEVK